MSERIKSLRDRVSKALISRLHHISPRMKTIHVCATCISIIFAFLTFFVLERVLSTYAYTASVNHAHDVCQSAAATLQETSNYLTTQARDFVSSGNREHLDNYLREYEQDDNRGAALRTLREHANSSEAVAALELARLHSDELAQTELRALRLVADAQGMSNVPATIKHLDLAPHDLWLNNDEKTELAHELVFGEEYQDKKLMIREQVQRCSEQLVGSLREELDQSNAHLERLMHIMRISIVALFIILMFVIVATKYLLLWPIALHEESIRADQPLVPGGARELRYLIDAYNDMYERNHDRTESLEYEARNDALTGLLNRGAYDELVVEHRSDSALILVDVDMFKRFNDDFGHEMGDAILIEVAATLYGMFRASDLICRIGGDEFAVIMTNADKSLRHVVATKLINVATFLRDTENGLPAVTISVGVAFGRPGIGEDELFKEADAALYLTKNFGRDGYSFAGDTTATKFADVIDES